MKKIMTGTAGMALMLTLILAGGVIVAGCTQGSSSNGGQPPTVADNGAQPANQPGSSYGNGSGHQNHGQGFLSNATLISEAAAKLGVSDEALRTALNSTAGGRWNMTAAAQQLGVAEQQLTDALGIPAGGFHGRNMTGAAQQATP